MSRRLKLCLPFLAVFLWTHELSGKSLRSASPVIRISTHNDTAFVQEILRLSKSAEMRNYMKEQLDPCVDFYEFACGNWGNIYPASVTQVRTSILDFLEKALKHKLRTMLETHDEATANPTNATTATNANANATATATATDSDKKVHYFYESCMQVPSMADTYKTRLHEIIAEFGSMPVLSGDKWRAEEFDWLETIARINYKYDIAIMIGFDSIADLKNSTVNRLVIAQADLPLESKSMYLDEKNQLYRSTYSNRIAANMVEYLGVEKKLAGSTAQDVVDVEVALAKGLTDSREGLGVTELSHLTTVEEMHAKYAPTIDIKRLVNVSLGELYAEPIYEYAPEYQLNLVEVIKHTPKRTMANYIFYTLIKEFFVKIEKTQKKQAAVCLDNTKKHFAQQLDNMIYRKYNTNETEMDVNHIWSELKDTFKWKLQSEDLKWINETTRQYAAEKLEAMKLEINSYADTDFTDDSNDMQMSKNDYLGNIKGILMQHGKGLRDNLHEPPSPIEAGETLSFTPANILMENLIKVPVALLQPYYLWSVHYPNALKFGNLGALIGHELIHGFDDSGRVFDKDGNNINWWDDDSTKEFVKRTQCFTDQYSQYKYGGTFLPKSTLQAENIADNGGLRLAYEAYLKWFEESARSYQDLHLETLPNMAYTSKQLFFISFAQLWCNDVLPIIKGILTATDDHVPGKFRVIGVLSNFPEFSKEFNCDSGTPMNPQKKCHIY